MKRTLAVTTIGLTVLLAAALAFAVLVTPRTGATTALCHMTQVSIEAPATVKAGRSIRVEGAEAVAPTHTVKATLQYRYRSRGVWKNGASMNLEGGAYSLKWKAPAKKGSYQLRVRVSRQSTANTTESVIVRVR